MLEGMEDDSRRSRRTRVQPSWVQANGHVLSESAALKRALKQSLIESKQEPPTKPEPEHDSPTRRRRKTEQPTNSPVPTATATATTSGTTKKSDRVSSPVKDVTKNKSNDTAEKRSTGTKRKEAPRTPSSAVEARPSREKRMKFRRDFLEDTMREINKSPRKKYCAQRKFATNCNGGYSSSPMNTPIKAFMSPGPSNPPPPLILPAAATQTSSPLKPTCKTEDFLTFLCLRGTSLCPDDLKFLENPPSYEPRMEEKTSILSKTKRNLQGKLSEVVDDSRPPRRIRESTESLDSANNRKDLVNHVAKLISAKYKKSINGVSQRLSARQSSSDSRSSTSTSRAERLKLRQKKVALIEKENKRRSRTVNENGDPRDNLEHSVAQRRTALIRSQSRRTQQNSRRTNLVARNLVRKAKSNGTTTRSPRCGDGDEKDDHGRSEEDDEDDDDDEERRATRSLGPIAEVALPIWPQYKLKQYELSLSKKTGKQRDLKTPKRIEKRRSERISSSTDCPSSSPRKSVRQRAGKPDVVDSVDSNERMGSIFLTSSPEEEKALNGLLSSQFEGEFGGLSTLTSSSSVQDTPIKATLNFMTDCGSPSGSVISRTSDTSFRKSTSSVDLSTSSSKVTKNRKSQVRWSIGEPGAPPVTKCEMSTCLVFEPTTEEFQDPLKYIRETMAAIDKPNHTMFKIVTPKIKDCKSTARSDCRSSNDMRFLAYNQFLHKLWRRWGPSTLQYACLRKAVKISEGKETNAEDETESADEKILHKRGCPLIGGVEVDVGHLYNTVQNFGGIQQVMEKKKWVRVADTMRIPRMAHDRVARLDEAYMRYCLPLEVMSEQEKEEVFKKVKEDHERRRTQEVWDENETLECVWPGRNMTLAVFERVARNIYTMWYKEDSGVLSEDVEHDFWAIVEARKRHVVVNCGNIDTLAYGCGFPQPQCAVSEQKKKKTEDSPTKAERVIPWNTKILAQHPSNVLRWLGNVSGVTIPTLHVSMLFTALPWYRDPHNVNWLDYLHSGASRIWYSVPASQADRFHEVVSKLAPHVHQSDVGIPSDACLIPPQMLLDRGVQLERIEQKPGEIMVILDGCYSSNVSCGYSISESVYFTWNDWLAESWQRFNILRENSEPPTFCLEQLIVNMAVAGATSGNKMEQQVRQDVNEILGRITEELGNSWSALEKDGVPMERKEHNAFPMECSSCRMLCGLAAAVSQDSTEPGEIFCLPDANQALISQVAACSAQKNNKKQKITTGISKPGNKFKIVYCYNMEELRTILKKLQQTLNE